MHRSAVAVTKTAFTVLINFQNIKAEQVNVNCRHVLTFFCLHGRAVIQDTVQTFLRPFPLKIDEIMLFGSPRRDILLLQQHKDRISRDK